MKKLLALVILLFLISGCVKTKPNVTDNRSGVPESVPVVDIAKNDLAKRLNISIDQVHVVKIENVDWPDSSLGYPEKGMMYAQVITPGFRIILKAGDRLYEYHSDNRRVAGPGS
jgi:hypothetical protein